MTYVILVDKEDKIIGYEEKIEAHKKGKLHRAFSIFIFNENKELLIQKRAKKKYQCRGLWSNTCCSHPNSIQNLRTSAQKRLKEKMGFKNP